MEENSSVVFVSCDQKKLGDSLVESMLGDLPEVDVCNGLNVYPWHISTKYYEVDVDLCVIKDKGLQSASFSERTEGIVLYFDCDNSNWINIINGWLPFLREFDSEIKLLVCEKCGEDNRKDVIDWCLKEKFELVEIQGVPEDEDFPETVGVARIKQALEAHVWPNLSMKSRKEPTKISELLSGMNRESNPAGSDLSTFLSDALEQDCTSDTINFEQLFCNLMSMKEKASGMNSEQRKDFAEKVVTAYWNAIGGDSDELSDDSSTGDMDYKKL